MKAKLKTLLKKILNSGCIFIIQDKDFFKVSLFAEDEKVIVCDEEILEYLRKITNTKWVDIKPTHRSFDYEIDNKIYSFDFSIVRNMQLIYATIKKIG